MPFSDIQLLAFALLTALIVTSIGFKKTVWFISLGYTAAIIVLVVQLILFLYPEFNSFNWLQCAGLLIWGCRLGAYLFAREKNAGYKDSVKSTLQTSQALKPMVKVLIWISASFLYVCMFSPALFATFTEVRPTSLWIITGIVVMFAGLYIEGKSDSQKSVFKASQPGAFCNTGLYRWVRYPNYLGEIMVWVGNFLIGIPFYGTWWYWLISITGLICIILIMIGSTKRLETKQGERYGSDPAYQRYIRTVPVLFPWIPVYSLKKVKVYLE